MKIRTVIFIGVFALGLLSTVFLYITADSEHHRKGVSTVSGVVTDACGEPLPGAVVSISRIHSETETNLKGWYYLEGVEDGEYTLEVMLDGYKTVYMKIDVDARHPRTWDVVLQPGNGTLEITAARSTEETSMSFSYIITGIFSFTALGAVRLRGRAGPVCGLLSILSWGFYIGGALALVGSILLLYPGKRRRGRKKSVKVRVAEEGEGEAALEPEVEVVEDGDTDEEIEEVVLKEDLHSKEVESESFPEDTETDEDMLPKMEKAVKEALEEKGPDDVIGEVLKKLGVDSGLCRHCAREIFRGAVVCRCGRLYHRACALEIGTCVECGAKLDVPEEHDGN